LCNPFPFVKNHRSFRRRRRLVNFVHLPTLLTEQLGDEEDHDRTEKPAAGEQVDE
jgi:hypothetical protein